MSDVTITGTFQPLTNDYGLGGSIVIGVPPSLADANAGLISVRIDGATIFRAFDPSTTVEGVTPPVAGIGGYAGGYAEGY